MAELSVQLENNDKALDYYQEALAIAQDLGDIEGELTTLTAIGKLHQKSGDASDARLAFEQVFSLYTSDNPAVLSSDYVSSTAFASDFRVVLKALSEVYWESQDFDKMVSVLDVTSRLEESEVATSLGYFGNVEALANLAVVVSSAETDTLISLYLNQIPNNTTAAQTSLLDILRRKGRVLENLAAFSQAIWRQPAEGDSEVREELNRTYAAIANLRLVGPGERSASEYKAALRELEGRLTTINYSWRQARNASPEGLKTLSESVSVENVQALIPADAALVEIVQYKVHGAKENPTASHYAAYVLTSQGDIRAVDLGDAAAIDQQAALFRQALRTRSGNIKNIARQLDEQLMVPIRRLAGDKTHLLISPDGQLNAIPFDALS